MTTGLPGGIGNTGFECGGITSPLIQLGLEHGLSTKDDGLPTVIYASHDYLQRFRNCNNSLLCKEILGSRRVPLPCIKVARHAPELYRQTHLHRQHRGYLRRGQGSLSAFVFSLVRKLFSLCPFRPEPFG